MRQRIACLFAVISMTGLGTGACGQPEERTRDPLTGKIADGSVEAMTSGPSLMYVLDDSEVLALSVTAVAGEDPHGVIKPALVGYRHAKMNGTELKPGHPVRSNSTLDGGVFKNLGPYTLRVEYFVPATGEEKSVLLRPGFGVLVGDPEVLAPGHKLGCYCECEDDDGEHWTITLDCYGQSNGGAEDDCNCDEYEGMKCFYDDPQSEPGESKECGEALIPDDLG